MSDKCRTCKHFSLSYSEYPCNRCEETDESLKTSYYEKEDDKEMVNHPSHYNKGKYEVIDVIYDWNLNFSLGSALKYIARADYKDKPIEDLKKAIQYIEFEIAKREKECED